MSAELSRSLYLCTYNRQISGDGERRLRQVAVCGARRRNLGHSVCRLLRHWSEWPWPAESSTSIKWMLLLLLANDFVGIGMPRSGVRNCMFAWPSTCLM